ncbi:MAG TPA: Fe-S cluster assembly protein SufD [Bacteroidia bacterium]|nr:Fe-S cluster assembly protein SufD [Bacteroidia bacterium]
MTPVKTLIEKIDNIAIFATEFERLKNTFPENVFLKNIRTKAFESFLNQGLPNKKNEEYKYASPEKLFFKVPFDCQVSTEKINQKEIEKYFIQNLNATVVVTINGSLSKENSTFGNLPKGVIICDFSEAIKQHSEIFEKHFSASADVNLDAFLALNTALATNGLFIYVPENTHFEKPLHLVNLLTAKKSAFLNTRNLIVIENKSELKIVETFDTVDLPVKLITNSVTEISVGENAHVQYYTIQKECENGNHIHATHVQQQANSHFDTNTITLGGSWIRNNLNIALNAKHCETHLNGLFITKENQHVDNHTFVDHRQPNCESRQLYKGILYDKSIGVFNGKIMVRPDAQKTNAYQSSKNILLSDDATINAKPQLEIYANDVKCSHGTSTGRLADEALFYLRSRGISEPTAKNLLMYAFTADVLDTLKLEALKTYVETLVEKELQHELNKNDAN